MVAGDVVSAVGSVTGATIIFQPAAGVSCCLTTIGGNGGWTHLIDGVNVANIQQTSNSTTGSSVTKIFVTNTNYFQVVGTSVKACWTGIQIK